MCDTTSTFPSPTWLIETLSPRLPVRPSTLMRSCRNFSKAAMSKILSETGCEQLIVYCSFRLCQYSLNFGGEDEKREARQTFLVTLAALPFWPFAYSFSYEP